MSRTEFSFIDATVTSTAETKVTGQTGDKAVIHNIKITPDSGNLVWLADGAAGTRIFQTATAVELNDMHIQASSGNLIEVDAAGGTTGYIKADGRYENPVAVGDIASASIAETTADQNIKYGLLRTGVANETIIVHRTFCEGTAASQVASVGYADDAAGNGFVALDSVSGDGVKDGKMSYKCPTGKFILLKNDASGAAAGAKPAYGYFHGEVLRT